MRRYALTYLEDAIRENKYWSRVLNYFTFTDVGIAHAEVLLLPFKENLPSWYQAVSDIDVKHRCASRRRLAYRSLTALLVLAFNGVSWRRLDGGEACILYHRVPNDVMDAFRLIMRTHIDDDDDSLLRWRLV